MTNRKKFSFRVVVELIENNEDTQRDHVKEYVTDAVERWGGQFPLDDDLFSTNIKVTVK